MATNTHAEIHNKQFFPSTASEPSREAQETRLLLNRLADGDRAAFWPLWEQHKKHLYTICLSQMKGLHNDAEDALSEAMLKAWHQLPRYACDIENCKAWLTRLTYNLCKDVHKRSKRIVAAETIEEIKENVLNHFHANQIMESPEEAILRRELELCLLYAINKLPAGIRELFVLRVIQEQTYPELAEQFAISVENARKRIQKARSILQKEIAVYFSGEKSSIPEKPLRGEIASLKATGFERARLEEKGEIRVDINATRIFRITLPSGEAKAIQLFLSHIPARPDTRLNTLRGYIERHPRGWKKRLERADLLYATGSWHEAIKEYGEVLRIQPRSINVCVHLGNTLHLMGRDEEAISIYKMALRATRSEATRLHVSGMIAVCLLQYYDAIERFKKAASTEPRNAIHWLRVGMTYLSLRNPVRALQAFDEALNINPQDIMALSESYVALRALGCDEEARQRVEQVLKVCPGDVLALKRMADHRCRPKLVLEPEVKKTHRLMLCAKRTPPNATEIVGSSACYKSDRNGFFYDGASRSAINAFSQNPVLPEDIFRYQVAYEILTSAH